MALYPLGSNLDKALFKNFFHIPACLFFCPDCSHVNTRPPQMNDTGLSRGHKSSLSDGPICPRQVLYGAILKANICTYVRFRDRQKISLSSSSLTWNKKIICVILFLLW